MIIYPAQFYCGVKGKRKFSLFCFMFKKVFFQQIGEMPKIETKHFFEQPIALEYNFVIYIFDSDLVWRMQLMVIKG